MLRLLVSVMFCCACLHGVGIPQDYQARMKALGLAPVEHLLLVSVSEQKATHYIRQEPIATYVISTAEAGVGAAKNSYQTPLGLHRIRDKIGSLDRMYTIFEGRKSTGRVWRQKDTDRYKGKDLILSRIMRMEGLEEGINRGRNSNGVLVDSYDRYIYIHGTNQEERLGSPASLGCIRMRNNDVVQLFSRLPTGSHVFVTE